MDRRFFIKSTGATVATSLLPTSLLAETGDREIQTWIMPDIRYSDRQTKTIEDNTYTIFWEVMNRWTLDTNGGIEIHRALADSDTYRGWLLDADDYAKRDGIPPHIQFGGAVVSGESDPTFHSRWVDRTRLALAEGRIS